MIVRGSEKRPARVSRPSFVSGTRLSGWRKMRPSILEPNNDNDTLTGAAIYCDNDIDIFQCKLQASVFTKLPYAYRQRRTN